MLLSLLLISTITTIFFMTLVFIVSEFKKDASIVDVFWGLGFILIALVCIMYAKSYTARQLLITWLVLIWGTRLSLQIILRKIGKPEDSRYAALRQEWGSNFRLHSYIYIFLVQALVMIIVAYPIIVVNAYLIPAKIGILEILGLFIWIIGFIFEVVGDWQLYSFLKNHANKGKILQTGLWRLSRHPNYFGESLMWWGIFLIALASPWGFVGIISPALLTYLLLYVSGIPPAEKQLEKNAEFQEYKKRTSAFIPMPPSQNKIDAL